MSAAVDHIPSPADTPEWDADELVAELRARGCRIHRMREFAVFVLTNDQNVAHWVLGMGGVSFLPRNAVPADMGPHGGYLRARDGIMEWDVYVHTIPVRGEKSVWEAAAP